ncbi:hypothetical protein E2C01_054645 [Portunus trituberculatus]|uniref:Secreted protein n=1 Tax=Portunus trituberculatus TaxID=210409 RepID=A0A5B7GSM0_PORTR|nr:hypothetical protein [Portunus trituberculatus]
MWLWIRFLVVLSSLRLAGIAATRLYTRLEGSGELNTEVGVKVKQVRRVRDMLLESWETVDCGRQVWRR